MMLFAPGLLVALVSAFLLVYAFRSHEKHWSLGFLGWRRVYLGLVLAFIGAVAWAVGPLVSIPVIWLLPVFASLCVAAGLALILSGSIERLRDLAAERKRLEELRAGFDLYDTLREVVSGPYTFLEVLEFALKEMVRAAEVGTGGLWLYNAPAREWILTGSANMSQSFRRQVESLRGSGTGFDRLARLHKAHVFSRPDEIRLFFPEWEAEGIQSILGLPLVTGAAGSSERRLLGIIVLADTSAARFDDDRARRLHAAADYVAAVIAEGRLQRQLEASHQQIEANRTTHGREVESLREQMRVSDSRIVEERTGWERELSTQTAALRQEFEHSRTDAESRISELERELTASRHAAEADVRLLRERHGEELASVQRELGESASAAEHQAALSTARIEEIRRSAEEEKRRLSEDAVARLGAERTRVEQAQLQIRTLESAEADLNVLYKEERRARTTEHHVWEQKLEALQAQAANERDIQRDKFQREHDEWKHKVADNETLVSAIEQELERRISDLRAQGEDERRVAMDEQRTLKQEIQSLRLSFADLQVQHSGERESFTLTLEAERAAQSLEREEWEATLDATQQLLLDIKLELENTRFESGMALVRLHNETAALRPVEATKPSASTEADPAGPSVDQRNEGEDEDSHESEQSIGALDLHAALLDWVSRQDADEWHLELMAHDTPSVDAGWLDEWLDETLRTCRGTDTLDQASFAIRTSSRGRGTVLRVVRSGDKDRNGDLERVGDGFGGHDFEAQWLYEGDERVGAEISFDGKTSPEEEGQERLPADGQFAAADTLVVLVVDDNEEMREMVGSMLESLAHAVATASSAKEGYAHYVSGQFDVVVLNAGLPRQDGDSLVTWIKSHTPSMPVVVMAGASASLSDDECSADAILIKPFGIEQLQESLVSARSHVPAQTSE